MQRRSGRDGGKFNRTVELEDGHLNSPGVESVFGYSVFFAATFSPIRLQVLSVEFLCHSGAGDSHEHFPPVSSSSTREMLDSSTFIPCDSQVRSSVVHHCRNCLRVLGQIAKTAFVDYKVSPVIFEFVDRKSGSFQNFYTVFC